jgi:predicted MFS family arabinose efflux permease
MTFVIALLRELGLSIRLVQGFYLLLGTAVLASSFIWANLMQRWRGGQLLALLNGLLACATLLPVLSVHPLWVLVSGGLFGAVFLALVASTTALVRHNLPAAAWPAGIAAFTVVFAGGQIVGPGLVGWLADSSGGGLRQGFAASAAFLAIGALFAWRQKPL